MNFTFKFLFLYSGLLVFLSLPAHSAEMFAGRVIGVSDGDTITVLASGKPLKVRLSEIDCPEKSQAFGQKAKDFTSKQSFSKNVKVLVQGKDRYKRIIGVVILPNGKNLNDLLVGSGYAWWYQKYSHDIYKKELEQNARKRKLGLWSDPFALAPWDFRKSR